ncbi:MAG: DNA mismatch repair protein MutS [Clostridia bacterium]|nr:DNA mismatch repair protein MutS [Clostridia bacterium]
MSKISPMMRKYFEMKEQYPDCIMFFRVGDFYEMFFEDAEVASKVLDLVLTGKDCGLEERAPMAGVPFHAVDTYIRKLIENGYRVAICEQIEDPATAKGLVERDVIRVVTPGTVMEEDILDEKSSNYLASVYTNDTTFGIAWTDISTGEFNLYEYEGANYLDRLSDILGTIRPEEVISNDHFARIYYTLNFFKNNGMKCRCYHEFAYAYDYALKKLTSLLNVVTLDAFECKDKKCAISASGGLMEYLFQTQKRAMAHINKLTYIKDNSFMILDQATRRNLELTSRAKDGKRQGSLINVIDKTVTAVGARTIRRWIEQPLQDLNEINARLDAVELFIENKPVRESLRDTLSDFRDLERLAGRIAFGNANPKDLLAIADTLAILPDIKASITGSNSSLVKKINANIHVLKDECKTLTKALDRDMPANFKLGGFIARGYSKELDDLRDIKNVGKDWLLNLENTEKEKTGIKTLKVGYNKVFGYYIEVSNSFKDKVPLEYIRKQTLVGGERFITPELKEIEDKILSADENAMKIENSIFENLKNMLYKVLNELQTTARAIGILDSILSLAQVAASNKYSRPIMNKKIKGINIVGGRHPVVEQILEKGQYVPNDTSLDSDENRTMVITGPNMAGKSTYMRQVALIVLMAHIGSFVPAESAEIALTDRIFTRIGASDDLSGGQSTFMVEMIEVATILNYATPNSLLILDEIGRGTSTFDGLSIAWAVLEYITKNLRAKTLFATHFHELTELEGLEGVKNYRVLVRETTDTIIFLHKIVRGGASRSFGIEVASLAGVKKEVVDNAKTIMKKLEAESKDRDTNSLLISVSGKNSKTEQINLFDNPQQDKIRDIIKDIDVNNITPLQALTILQDLKREVEDK